MCLGYAVEEVMEQFYFLVTCFLEWKYIRNSCLLSCILLHQFTSSTRGLPSMWKKKSTLEPSFTICALAQKSCKQVWSALLGYALATQKKNHLCVFHCLGGIWALDLVTKAWGGPRCYGFLVTKIM